MEFGILGLIIAILDIMAILSVLNSGASVAAKVLWTVVILALPVLGLILWYLIGAKSTVTA